MQPDFKKFNDQLVPAIVQDFATQKVLMLGYMNAEALEKTIATERITFYSRSKKRLWTKGEESGNFLVLKSIDIDCDKDCLLLKAQPVGPTCHTGADTCWNEKNTANLGFITILEAIIQQRKTQTEPPSYIKSLFDKGINAIAQKVGEEAVELIIEAKDNDEKLFINEAADLLFHYLILLQAKGFVLENVLEILQKRHQKKSATETPKAG